MSARFLLFPSMSDRTCFSQDKNGEVYMFYCEKNVHIQLQVKVCKMMGAMMDLSNVELLQRSIDLCGAHFLLRTKWENSFKRSPLIKFMVIDLRCMCMKIILGQAVCGDLELSGLLAEVILCSLTSRK